MKIEIHVDEQAADMEISVTCKQLMPDIEKMIATLRMMNHQLTAKKDDEIHLLDTAQIIYIESVDRKCFVFFTDGVIKKMLIWLRTICMLAAIVAIIAAFIIAFHWFPTDMWQPWAMFFLCFGLSFLGSYFVMSIKENTENKKMEEALKRLKEKGDKKAL